MGGGNIACHIIFVAEWPVQTSHCMGGGNIACHIIFVAESLFKPLTVWVEVILHAILFS